MKQNPYKVIEGIYSEERKDSALQSAGMPIAGALAGLGAVVVGALTDNEDLGSSLMMVGIPTALISGSLAFSSIKRYLGLEKE